MVDDKYYMAHTIEHFDLDHLQPTPPLQDSTPKKHSQEDVRDLNSRDATHKIRSR